MLKSKKTFQHTRTSYLHSVIINCNLNTRMIKITPIAYSIDNCLSYTLRRQFIFVLPNIPQSQPLD